MASGVKTPRKKEIEVVKDYVKTKSYNATSKNTGVDHKTVKRIIEDNPKEYQQEKERFIERTSKLIDKALDRLDEGLDRDNIPINNISTALGTLYDKRALARGETTSNNSIKITMSDDIKELSK